MFNGFKQFMLRGNVSDLAVAVVIGGAFGGVVTALVKDLITPLLSKDYIDVTLALINGRIHQLTMRVLKANVKSEHKNGTQLGEYSFGGGEPRII